MISESYYPRDIRVRKEAQKLAKNNHKVYIIALKNTEEKKCEKIDGITVYRIPKLEIFNESKQENKGNKNKIATRLKGILGYGIEYTYFTTLSLILSVYLLVIKKIKVVHLHNPPDTLVLIGQIYRTFGRLYIFDQHDLSSDLFKDKFGEKLHFILNILVFFEKLSFNFADAIIVTNNSYRAIAIERYKNVKNKIYVVRNGPDVADFELKAQKSHSNVGDKILVTYVGAINYQDGLDNLIKIADIVINHHKFINIKFQVIGDGDYLSEIIRMSRRYKVEKYFEFKGYICDKHTLNKMIVDSDICVDTANNTFYNRNSTFIKLMEYMVFNKPVISFALKESINTLGNAGIFIEPSNFDQFAEKLIYLSENRKLRESIGLHGGSRIEILKWENVSINLIELYKKLLA